MTVTKKALTITAQTQTIRFGETVQSSTSQVTCNALANGDTLGSVDLSASQTSAGIHTGAITASNAVINRGNSDVTANYAITYQPGDLTVQKKTPAVSVWPTAGSIYYGQTLGDSTLSGGSADTNGAFTWLDSTVKPDVGTRNGTVAFTPDDSANYETVSQEISLTVEKAVPTVTAPTAPAIEYGQPLPALTSSGSNPYNSSSVPGAWTWNSSGGTPITGTYQAAFTPTDTDRYNPPEAVDIAVTVNPAQPVITITATSGQQAGKAVAVSAAAESSHDAALADLPEVKLTYQIGGGTETDITDGSFTIPAGAAVGTIITVTAKTEASPGKYSVAAETATVTVTDQTAVEGVTLDRSSLRLKVGDVASLNAAVEPADAGNPSVS